MKTVTFNLDVFQYSGEWFYPSPPLEMSLHHLRLIGSTETVGVRLPQETEIEKRDCRTKTS